MTPQEETQMCHIVREKQRKYEQEAVSEYFGPGLPISLDDYHWIKGQVESSTAPDPKSHNVLIILCSVHEDTSATGSSLTSQRSTSHQSPMQSVPIMGACFALTATPGEVEIRWGFSRLIEMCPSWGRVKYEKVASLLEGAFAFRLILEGTCFEDMRIFRGDASVRKKGDAPPSRFISIVTMDLCLFPLQMMQAFLKVQGFCRHYNTMADKTAEHRTQCTCKRRCQVKPTTQRTAKLGKTLVRKPVGGILKTGPWNRRSITRRLLDGSSSSGEEADENRLTWSFYGLSAAQLERAANALFDGPPLPGDQREKLLRMKQHEENVHRFFLAVTQSHQALQSFDQQTCSDIRSL